MKLDLLNRGITAAALIALAVTLGVWLSRAPLTAAPATTPLKIAPEPTLAPPPPSPMVTPPPVARAVIEVPVEVEIAPTADPPAANSDGPSPESKPSYPPHRHGLFRRR